MCEYGGSFLMIKLKCRCTMLYIDTLLNTSMCAECELIHALNSLGELYYVMDYCKKSSSRRRIPFAQVPASADLFSCICFACSIVYLFGDSIQAGKEAGAG